VPVTMVDAAGTNEGADASPAPKRPAERPAPRANTVRAAVQGLPLMRPPYGSITARQKQWINAEFGYRTILWDVDPLDWKRPGAAVVESRIVRETRPGSIILSHDIHPGTIQAMPETFDQLQKKGFKFVTVSELIAMDKPAPWL